LRIQNAGSIVLGGQRVVVDGFRIGAAGYFVGIAHAIAICIYDDELCTVAFKTAFNRLQAGAVIVGSEWVVVTSCGALASRYFVGIAYAIAVCVDEHKSVVAGIALSAVRLRSNARPIVYIG
jgi:hypothetical protein